MHAPGCSQATGVCAAGLHSPGWNSAVRKLKALTTAEQLDSVLRFTDGLDSQRVLRQSVPDPTLELAAVKDLVKEMKTLAAAVEGLRSAAQTLWKVGSMSLSVLRSLIISNTELVSAAWGFLVVAGLAVAAAFLKERLRIT